MNRARLRDLGINIGKYPTGKNNAITDVPGVLVGQVTVISDEPVITRTGVTVIAPRDRAIGKDYAFAGFHRYNGCGEMTGIQWLEETGMLTSAIALTNTFKVGMVRDALTEFSIDHDQFGPFFLPVAGETYDGWLNDITGPGFTREHVFQALETVRGGHVDEGNVGGGTGMICHEFKGGIGTSSRMVETNNGTYNLGVLVQANHGNRAHLRINGIPVGEDIGFDAVPSPWKEPPESSSILIVIATDAPLLSDHCRRLAQRAANGVARTGGFGYNSSGDLFLAFATGLHIPAKEKNLSPLEGMLPHRQMDVFFEAVTEAVEESILNAIVAAETMQGLNGHIAHAIPLDLLKKAVEKFAFPT
jgi:D-aminopeptidase